MTTVAKAKTNLPAVDFGIPLDYHIDIAQEDIKVPSVILLQKMTELVELEDVNWKAGQFYDMGTDSVVDSFDALIVSYFVTARLLGEKDPKTGRAEALRFSSDGRHWDDDGAVIQPDEFKWKEDGQFAKKSFHYLVLIKGTDMPTVVTFKGASAKMAKHLNMHLMRTKPSWRSYFHFQSSQEESNGNKYHVLKANPKPKDLCDQDTADLCLGFWEMSQETRISSNEMTADNSSVEIEEPTY